MNTTDIGLAVLRLGVGITFALHGGQKVFGWWGGPGLVGWKGAMARMGFLPSGFFAWLSAMIELAGGVLLAVGLATPLVAGVLLAQTVVIVGYVHWPKGFFNAKGGFEFPLVLGAGEAAILLTGPGAVSLDAAMGFGIGQSARGLLVLIALIVGAVAMMVPRLRTVALSRQPR